MPRQLVKSLELVKILPKLDGIFTTHMRNEAIDVIKSVKETIEICSSTKVRTVISHHKCAGRDNWGKSKETLKLINEAKKDNFLIWIVILTLLVQQCFLKVLLREQIRF